MQPVTRRSFLVTSSASALGVAGAAAIGAPLASASTSDEADPEPDQLDALDDPALLQVRDAGAGEVELMVAERSIVFTDKRLVARLLRASR